jgi:uncharacterized protein
MNPFPPIAAHRCAAWLALLLFLIAAPGVMARDCPVLADTPEGAQAHATRHGQGLLWRIEDPREGAAPSYLYGTMHVDFPEVTRLAPPAALAFARSRALVVEVILDDAAQASYERHMTLPEGEADLSTALGEPVASEYLQLAARLGVNRALADRLTPWAAANLIARPPPRAGGVTLDEALQRRALASGQEVHALETMETLLTALSEISREDHLLLLVDAVCQADRLNSELAVDVRHYLAGDLDALMARAREPIARDPAFGRHWKRLVDDRNRAFMQALTPHLPQGGLFIAVGALHLPGEQGLLARLEATGYRLSRVFGGRDEPGPGAALTATAAEPAAQVTVGSDR